MKLSMGLILLLARANGIDTQKMMAMIGRLKITHGTPERKRGTCLLIS